MEWGPGRGLQNLQYLSTESFHSEMCESPWASDFGVVLPKSTSQTRLPQSLSKVKLQTTMRIASQQCEALADDTQSHLHCCLWPKVAYGSVNHIEPFFSQDFKISQGIQIPKPYPKAMSPTLTAKPRSILPRPGFDVTKTRLKLPSRHICKHPQGEALWPTFNSKTFVEELIDCLESKAISAILCDYWYPFVVEGLVFQIQQDVNWVKDHQSKTGEMWVTGMLRIRF